MNKVQLIQALDSYARRCDDEEEEFVYAMHTFVTTENDPFSRQTAAGHITASAWILDTNRTHALLCHHRKLDMWVQLGGHLEPSLDDSVHAGALREAYEESGLGAIKALSPDIFDIDIHAIPAHGDEAEHLHYDVRYLFAARSANAVQLTPESKELAWVRLDEIHKVSTEKSLLRMAKKATQFLRNSTH